MQQNIDDTYARFCVALRNQAAETFDELVRQRRAVLRITESSSSSDDDLESGSNSEPPGFTIEIEPTDDDAAGLNVLVWPGLDVQINIAKNGARVEWEPPASEDSSVLADFQSEVRSFLASVFDLIVSGRIEERLELDSQGVPRAVFTTGWDSAGHQCLNLLHVVGGRKKSESIVRYSPY